jgi:hypothetical protein
VTLSFLEPLVQSANKKNMQNIETFYLKKLCLFPTEIYYFEGTKKVVFQKKSGQRLETDKLVKKKVQSEERKVFF